MNLELIPKIGTKTLKLLGKINIETDTDLLTYYPYNYKMVRINDITKVLPEQVSYIKAKLISPCNIFYYPKKLTRLTFIAKSSSTSFQVTIFNRAYLKEKLETIKEFLLIGKYDAKKNIFLATDIDFDITERIIPIYHLTKGITNNNLEDFIKYAIIKTKINDYLPIHIKEKYNFLSRAEALKKIHNPQTIQDVKQSKLRLKYEELFEYMFKIHYLQLINKQENKIKKTFDKNKLNEFMSLLSFKLTIDQEAAINDILTDLNSSKIMNRLVIGDVGSGKTIVAIVALLANYLSGYQSAFMAPTEILARQHYESIKEYFKYYNIKVDCLVGSFKKSEKNIKYKDIESGNTDIVIGTHALLNNDLKFNNLGLIITDEQHRFGVNQRKKIQTKGMVNNTDILYLSATPIPRTYALTLYGDLDISKIQTKPSIRKPIKTKIIEEKDIKIVLTHMLEEIKNKHQIFVIAPAIENEDINSVIKLKEKLKKAFKEYATIEIIHGKLKDNEKTNLMNDFLKNKINILISTTVIEVGVDIPNATMIVIYNAERFGLATLHQLRGRVGRSNLQSYCYLIGNPNNSRLKVLEESNDGFYISEMDFKQRGEGDLFGTKQSGELNFKITNIKEDLTILLQASQDSKYFIETKEYLNNTYYKEITENLNLLN